MEIQEKFPTELLNKFQEVTLGILGGTYSEIPESALRANPTQWTFPVEFLQEFLEELLEDFPEELLKEFLAKWRPLKNCWRNFLLY